MSTHSTLTGADLHEPKGADAASANKVYVSDGAGSGSWSDLPLSALDNSGATTDQFLRGDNTFQDVKNANKIYLQARLDDISSASSVYIPCPLAGDITSVVTVLQGAIATTDGDVRLQIGGVPVTDSNVTIANASSAAGDVDTATPTAANTVTANSAVQVETQGNATTAEAVEVLIEVTLS